MQFSKQCYNPLATPQLFKSQMNTRKTIWTFSITLVLLTCALSIQAQSGRRQQRAEPAAPVPTPTPEATPKPKTEQKDPDLVIVIGAERNSSFSAYPFTFYDAAIAGCADVLSRSSAKIEPTSKSVNRNDAIKRAKQDTKTYVVFLQLTTFASSATVNTNYDQIEVEYTVFAPGTAKIATSGRALQNGRRAGPVVVGSGVPGGAGVYREEMLKRAGQDAGDRILHALHLDTPRTN